MSDFAEFVELSGNYKNTLKSKFTIVWDGEPPDWIEQMNADVAVLRMLDTHRKNLYQFLCDLFTNNSEEVSCRFLADFYDKRNDPVFYEDAEKLKNSLNIGKPIDLHIASISDGMRKFFLKY